MGYPELILLAFYSLTIGRHLLKHGEPVTMEWYGWVMCFVYPTLLAWGGFFSSVGIPQVIYTLLWVMGTGALFLNRKDVDDSKYNFYNAVIGVALGLGLYWWGGFFS